MRDYVTVRDRVRSVPRTVPYRSHERPPYSIAPSHTTTVSMRSLPALHAPREYTDASFRTRKAAPPHQGLLGPTITAEVRTTLPFHVLNSEHGA